MVEVQKMAQNVVRYAIQWKFVTLLRFAMRKLTDWLDRNNIYKLSSWKEPDIAMRPDCKHADFVVIR